MFEPSSIPYTIVSCASCVQYRFNATAQVFSSLDCSVNSVYDHDCFMLFYIADYFGCPAPSLL